MPEPLTADNSPQDLEAFLANEAIPLQERARIASQILGLSPTQPATAQTQPELSPEWKQWIIENKALGVADRDLMQAMLDNGIDSRVASAAIASVTQERAVQAQHEDSQRLRKLESILKIKRQLAELLPRGTAIERRSRLSRQEFLEQYYATNTPVILTDMMSDWPAMSSWSPDYLKQKYGTVAVEVQTQRNADPNYEINTHQHKQTVLLSQYADWVVNGGETNDYYMVANNGNLEREELKSLLDDVHFPDFLSPENTKERIFFWFGPAGTITPLHHDPMNVMMAHVCGRKRWRLISPESTPLVYNNIGVFSEVDLENLDLETYPLFEQVRVLEAVLEPGEIIFVPVGWWHQVKGLDVSLALSFTNFDFPNDYHHDNPNIKTPKPQQVRPKQNNRQAIASLSSQTLTNEIVETSEAEYLVDKIYPGEALILSFGFVSWDSPPKFDFYGRTKKLESLAGKRLNRILVRDVANAWYHRGVAGLGRNVDEVAEGLKALIAKIEPSEVIAIGQSMGAYAAIMFGQLIGVDRIIAFGPLSFLESEKARAIGDTRWLSVMSMLERERPEVCYFDLLELCKNSPHAPEIQLFYGKKPDNETQGTVNLDDFHAQRLAALPNCHLYAYEESAHAIVQYLIDNKRIDRVLLKAIFDLNVETPLPSEVEFLPEGWNTWILENLMRGVPPEHLVETLQKQGFASADIKAAMDSGQIQYLRSRIGG